MSTVKNIVIGLFALALLACMFWLGRRSVSIDTETVTVVDTVKVFAPTPVSTETKVVQVKVPKLVFAEPDTVVREVMVAVGDDSVSLNVEVEKREYRDSNYYAVVSGPAIGGLRPALDYFETYNTTTNTVQTRRKRPKFAFTAGVGYGYTPKGFQPIVGVNFGVVIWSF